MSVHTDLKCVNDLNGAQAIRVADAEVRKARDVLLIAQKTRSNGWDVLTCP